MNLPRVLYHIPTYDGTMRMGINQALIETVQSQKCDLVITSTLSSLLAYGFNIGFCKALNLRKEGVTHYAMNHSDVEPEALWLTKALDIMDEKKADVLSVILPIKTPAGLTSIGLIKGITWPKTVKRLTMTDVYQRGPTFTDPDIVVNTGLLLIDMRKAWVENAYFEIQDRILKDQAGKFYASNLSEDWFFSIRARQMGAKIWATRAIKAKHVGGANYENDHPWGTTKEDEWHNV